MSLSFENAKVSETLSFSNNISNKKEIDLQKEIETLSEQNKRLLSFAYIVSHNLRSHTSNIQMLINLLEFSNSDQEKEEFFNLLKNSSLKLVETIYRLDEIISIENGLNKLKVILNLYNEVNNTLNILKTQINIHKISIVNNIAKEILVEFNSAYFESILLNLISNAIKYRTNKREGFIYLNSYYQEKYIVLEVSDNGKGIDLEKYGNKIFGMYKTFHNNPDARGIGLFITKNQIEALGGKIEVYSKLDEGTTFKVFFLK